MSGAATGQSPSNARPILPNPGSILTPSVALKRSAAGLRCNLRREISDLFLDALAELVPHEARHGDRGAELLGRGLDHLPDPALAVDHVDLFQQHDLFVE